MKKFTTKTMTMMAIYCALFVILDRISDMLNLFQMANGGKLMLLNCGVGEDPESPLGCKEIQPVHSEGDQPWVFFGRDDAKAETPVLWPPHAKS